MSDRPPLPAPPTLGRRDHCRDRSLAPGEVVSYGDVAHDAGRPGAARAVGALLASTNIELPWWRVVRADGRIVTGQAGRQAALLRAEGVVVRRDRVVAAPIGRFAGVPGQRLT